MSDSQFHTPSPDDRKRGGLILVVGLAFLLGVVWYFFSSFIAIDRLSQLNPAEACLAAEKVLRRLLQFAAISFLLLAFYYYHLGIRIRQADVYPLDKTASLFRIKAVRGAAARAKASTFLGLSALLIALGLGASTGATCIEVPCKRIRTVGVTGRDIERFAAAPSRGKVVTLDGCSIFSGR